MRVQIRSGVRRAGQRLIAGVAVLVAAALPPVDSAAVAAEQPGADRPGYVVDLERAYGPPSQAGFGSAVFFDALPPEADLSEAALGTYRHFVGPLWERFGEPAWMQAWKEVYSRGHSGPRDVVNELRGIGDSDARHSVPMILDNIEGAEAARAALSLAFDDPSVTELRAYNIGDGGAMSGLLLAGRRDNGETTQLVFLLD